MLGRGKCSAEEKKVSGIGKEILGTARLDLGWVWIGLGLGWG